MTSFVGSAALAPSAQAAPRTFTLSITKIAKTNLRIGDKVVLSGKVTPASKAKNADVQLQVRNAKSKSWTKAASITLSRNGTFSKVSVPVVGQGTWFYRICIAKANGYKSACSAQVRVTVKAPPVPAKYQGSGSRNKMTWDQYQKAIGSAQALLTKTSLNGQPLETQLQGIATLVNGVTKTGKFGKNLPHSGDPYGVLVLGNYTAAGANRTVGLILDIFGIQWKYASSKSQTHQWIIVTSHGKSYIVDGMAGIVAQVKNPQVYPSIKSLRFDGTIYRGPGC